MQGKIRIKNGKLWLLHVEYTSVLGRIACQHVLVLTSVNQGEDQFRVHKVKLTFQRDVSRGFSKLSLSSSVVLV